MEVRNNNIQAEHGNDVSSMMNAARSLGSRLMNAQVNEVFGLVVGLYTGTKKQAETRSVKTDIGVFVVTRAPSRAEYIRAYAIQDTTLPVRIGEIALHEKLRSKFEPAVVASTDLEQKFNTPQNKEIVLASEILETFQTITESAGLSTEHQVQHSGFVV